MRKSAWSVAVLLILTAAIGLWLYPNSNRLMSPPFSNEKSLTYLSKVTTDADGNVALIGDSRQEIVLVDSQGTLSSRYSQQASDGRRHDFNDAVAAPDGVIYALDTVLDNYGLYVQEERIVRFEPGSSAGTVLYSLKGDGTDKRVGQIKGLQAEGPSIYFYTIKDSTIQQHALSVEGGEAKQSFAFDVPDNRFLSEIVGYEPGLIYYATKRGAIFRVAEDGSSEMAYPLQGMERTRTNFPEALQLHSDGRLYFIDRLLNAVTSLKAADSTDLRIELAESSLQAKAPDAENLEMTDMMVDPAGMLHVALDDRVLNWDQGHKTATVYKSVDYDREFVWQGWLVWLAAAVLLVSVITMLRLVYVNLLNRRISLFVKQIVTLVPILTISMLLLCNFVYNSFSSRMEDEMQRQLSLLARNGQNIINGDQLNKLSSPNDYRNEDYMAIYRKMNFLFESEDAANRKGLYSTLYKYENGGLFIMMDDDDGVNMYKPFPLSDENQKVLEQGEVITGKWEDATGKWLYGIGPIYDSSGKIVGIYETGRDLNVLYESNKTIYSSIVLNIAIISLILIALIAAATYFMLSSLRKLRRSVMDMANGNWNVEVNLKSRDEVGDLGEQFNLMARHIRNYIKDITSFSEASHRFVPQQFFKYLGKKGILDIHLGDQVQQNMTVMVANIRAFEQLSKQLSPKQNFDFMNNFLKRFSPFVRKEEGLISKYLGAGFMALFPTHADDALRAAVSIRRELTAYNEHLAGTGFKPVDLGMAIHKGPLMLGIVGEEQRMEGNVISDDVNMTTVLEKVSETMGAPILATRTFFEQLRSPERFRHRSLGRIRIEGKDEPIELIDVYEGDSETIRQLKDRTKTMFERGILLCQEGRFFDARETFVEVIRQNRADKAARLYFYLCDEYYQKGSAEGWNGTLAV
ncbi:adenylate/guanylate cyclase domain-containing protein [Paenibacillus sp. NEAU-GSW1]|uniref:adenylate/guanylate cyclase domain-containing protein n=1 Tax=Paenibacillus sp. NEAU-GSW1 TaxID=2682486 RepID=UPI001C12A083|nr:adenylate/guanylate cyclase domain-containing protein [Paenibacillus sp. NEAU-GSW1]